MRGETLAVLGRSGSGKSVLLKLIIGLEKPDSGSVFIHGRDIAGMSLDRIGKIRKKMGFSFQHAALYDSLTIEQNVAFPLEHHRKDMTKAEQADRVKELLEEVGMVARPKEDAVGYFGRHAETSRLGTGTGAGAGYSAARRAHRGVRSHQFLGD